MFYDLRGRSYRSSLVLVYIVCKCIPWFSMSTHWSEYCLGLLCTAFETRSFLWQYDLSILSPSASSYMHYICVCYFICCEPSQLSSINLRMIIALQFCFLSLLFFNIQQSFFFGIGFSFTLKGYFCFHKVIWGKTRQAHPHQTLFVGGITF